MTNDGRRDPRKPTVLQIRFKNATVAEFLEKHSRDISRGGIFIKMKSPFPPGTLIKFDIRIAEDSMIHGVGRVAWCRQQDESQKAPSGMGVKFIKLDEKSRLILDAVLAEKDPKEEAHTPLFDDALPKPKSKPPRIPKIPKAGSRAPQSDENTDVPRPSTPKSGVALEDDTKKIPREKKAPPKPPAAPKNFGDEAETVVSDTARLKDVLKMARRSVEGDAKEGEVKKEDAGEDTAEQTEIKELTNTENLFTEDISSAIEDALQPDESEAETTFLKRASSSDSTSSTPISTAADYQDISSRPTTTPPPTRRPSPLIPAIIGLGALLLAGGIFYFVFGRNSSAGSDTATEPVSQHAAPSETPAEPKVTPAPEAVATESTEAAPSTDTTPMPAGETTTIEVASTPKGATVLVDDEPQDGTTPLVLDKLMVDKPVEITVHHFGYCPQTRTVSPKAEGEKLNINLRLAAFKIDINSEPSGAKITIEDKGFGATPRTMRPSRISPEIEVRLAKDGYETAVQRFQETDWHYENETFSLHVNAVLTPISTPPSPTKYTSAKSSKSKKPTQSAPAPSTTQTPPKSKPPATAAATETTESAKSESAPAAAPPKPPANDEDQAKPPKEPAKTETPTEKPDEPAEKTEKPPAESTPPPEAPKPAAPEEKPPEKPAPKPDAPEKKPAPEPAPKPKPKDPSSSIDENPF